MNTTGMILVTVIGMGLAVLTFTIINYYQVRHIEDEDAGKSIKAILIYQTKLLPVLIALSMVVAISFNFGKRAFADRVWVPALVYFAFEVIIAAICAYYFFREVPSKGTLVGSILCVAGAVLAMVWK